MMVSKTTGRPMAVWILLCILLMQFTAEISCWAAEKPDSPLHAPRQVKAASYSWDRIRVSWEPQKSADGYMVYRASRKDGTYKRVYMTDNPEKNWYINTNRITGKTFYYKVRAYQMKDGKRIYSPASKIVSARARPRKVKGLQVETTGFQGSRFDLLWDPVSGADGYQISLQETGTEDWKPVTVVSEPKAVIKIPDTSCCYRIRVRAFRISEGKKVWGLFSEPVSYVFTWNPEMVKREGETILKERWPDICLEERNAEGERKTPYNGTTWYAVWPLRCCSYENWESVRNKLEEKITAAMEMGAGGLDGLCFYLSPDSSENWVELYMLC